MHKWVWKSESRYYIVWLQTTLFGEWTLVKNWGGLNNRLGGAQVQTFGTVKEALSELEVIGKMREKRGYRE